MSEHFTRPNIEKVIGTLGTTPEQRGLSTQEFKDKFDEMPEAIQQYIKETLLIELDAFKQEFMTHQAENVTQAKMVTWDLTSAGSQVITFEALDTIKRLDVIAVNPWAAGLKRCNGFHSINGGSYCEAYYAAEKYYKLISGIFIAIHDTGSNATRATVSISGNVLTLNWAKLGTGATGETEIAIIAQTH